MDKEKFEKVNAAQIARIYSKFAEGESAKINGILLLIFGFCSCFGAIFFGRNLSFDAESTKYLMIAIFVCCGIGFIAGGIISLLRNRQYQAIVRPILKNGLITKGYVANIVSSRRFSGLFSRRTWKYKIDYSYTDDKGKQCSGEINFHSVDESDFVINKEIAVAFYNGQSVMVEFLP